jgi:hypothetical protein
MIRSRCRSAAPAILLCGWCAAVDLRICAIFSDAFVGDRPLGTGRFRVDRTARRVPLRPQLPPRRHNHHGIPLAVSAVDSDQRDDAKLDHDVTMADLVWNEMTRLYDDEALVYAESMFGPADETDSLGSNITLANAALYALFKAIRNVDQQSKQERLLGLSGQPFVLRRAQVHILSSFPNFFTMKDLKEAVTNDFLDAARGSTDNRRPWQVWYQRGTKTGMDNVFVSLVFPGLIRTLQQR